MRKRRRSGRRSIINTISSSTEIAEVWRHGSVISSWLLDLTAAALADDPSLEKFGGRVSDSGEGRWTLQAANDEGVPAHVLAAALFERFASRDQDVFQNKVLSAMRFGFGGHAGEEVKGEPSDGLVFFGATGDLAFKKIFPALHAMAKRGKLTWPVVGVARSGWTREQFVEHAKKSIERARPAG